MSSRHGPLNCRRFLNRYDSEEERVERTGYATAFAPFAVAYVKAELQAHMSACSLPMNDERLIEQCLSAYVERLLGIGLKNRRMGIACRASGRFVKTAMRSDNCGDIEPLATDEYRGHMYAKYPVLLRFVTQTTVHYIDFVKEMLDRVSMDIATSSPPSQASAMISG